MADRHDCAADWPAEQRGDLDANNAAGAAMAARESPAAAARGHWARVCSKPVSKPRAPAALPDALLLARSRDVTSLPGYADGAFSVQDGAAQFAAPRCSICMLVSACSMRARRRAAKAHISSKCADVELLALDRDAARLPRLRENLARLGPVADVRAGDAAEPKSWWDAVRSIASCSMRRARRPASSGASRTSNCTGARPTSRARRRPKSRLLDALWPMLKPGGRLVYATCSVLAGGECAADRRVCTARAAGAVAAAEARLARVPGAGEQNLPGESGMDGFFYAIVEKRN